MSLLDYLEDRRVTIRDLPIRTSSIILITICLSIGVMNIVSTVDDAESNMSLRYVENATGHHQNTTTLSKQSVPPINDTIWGFILGTIVGNVIDEYNNNAQQANPTGNNSGITSGIVLQWVGAIAPAAGLFFVGWQAMSTRGQLKVMKRQLGRAWVGFDGVKIDGELKQVIFLYKNFGTIPAKIFKATSLPSMNKPTEDIDS